MKVEMTVDPRAVTMAVCWAAMMVAHSASQTAEKWAVHWAGLMVVCWAGRSVGKSVDGTADQWAGCLDVPMAAASDVR